ncbi:pyridoxal-phosphate-dependent aminotransferase family protein [Desulfovibrio litoralis]|uniref:Alanine-glyoxylate transaminase / serine-glyoxylate transaminase / serine-pyruvate transaminase n=1 Tax=Desulfovibrio litoralis DSM 11393 TaxID=1121455 RepID=A0A1M7SAD8_9BACT|nr:alanine--glyoxylate aminotransferase family protein [Desulfovibrio litoralis]SHN55450.1 alanine-glyoxylate transaminase / serine-glyoxylate transaminase / serine-pyruvate transaminase [Desulfovibrio litoralis DSM 11393]
MQNLLSGIKPTLLMGPGPSCVPDAVYKALAMPTLGHLDPYFIRIMDEIKEQLKTVMSTKNHLTMPMSGTGSAGMETCFVNLLEPKDKVLILINGVFGKRMQDLASRLGAEVDALEFEWGTPVLLDKVEEALKKNNYKVVAVVHAETSTGVCNPVKEIGELVAKSGALFLVDAVTSLGGMPVLTDEWKIDAIYSGTQKCLSCPPGLSPVSFSARAVETLKNRKTKVPNWYLDLTMIINYWEGQNRSYHHTAPINMLYALDAALSEILNEGLPTVYERHKKAHNELVTKLDALGLEMLVTPEARLPMLNAVKIPKKIIDAKSEANIRKRLLDEYNIEIGAGLGPLAGQIWRIGLMGHTARTENINTLCNALKTVLS